jgi:hypothetical protein
MISARVWGVIVAALAMLTGACGDGPSTGSCEGAIGAVDLNVSIDRVSHFHRIRKTSCASLDRGIFDFSYGNAALTIVAETPAANIGGIVAYTHETYALPPTTEETQVKSWEIVAPSDRPEFSSGTLTLDGAVGRKEGSFTMQFADTTSVTCSFDLRHTSAEGTDLDCGDGDGDD